ncbi:probable E3 ubiquitin-protein ligase RHC2A [Impatiens glandulifera]|uniref:probable E3 ubiquitin-protein ligase RHC2A n=1 Tax=Impatiens glandulifera TaxID=253017 RepID=UPI001FB1788A|nr:probable E3 ubiquitin-protein ligase RHC2A [Impatiens glandulifera]
MASSSSSFEDYFDLDMAMSMDWSNREEEDKDSSSPATTEEEMSSFVSEMPTVVADDGTTNSDDDVVCAVCMENFGPDSSGKRLPCCHVYHSTCIAKWLSIHDSCPLCRCRIYCPTTQHY